MISPIINGNFDCWTHRDFYNIGDKAPLAATGGYWSDRFGHRGSLSQVSPERRQFAPGERPGSRYYHRTTVASVPNGCALVANDIHRVDTLAGQVSTLFFDFRADQPCNIAVQWQRTYGTDGSDVENLPATILPVTAEWATYRLLVALPSVAGKIIGPQDDDYVTPIWWYEGAHGLPNRSGVFDIARVGWLAGDLSAHPDPFSLSDTSRDVERCRAYSRMGEGQENLFNGQVTPGQVCWSSVSFGAPLRTTPKMTVKTRGQCCFADSGSVQATRFGFNECRTATGTGRGWFWSRWLADAEFPYTP